MKKTIQALLKAAEKITGRKILIARDNARQTAVLSDMGFWYAGNILDTADLAHGMLQNGIIEAEETRLVASVLDLIVSSQGRLSLYDIGANTGYYGILAGFKYKGNVSVQSFEPLAYHSAFLKSSIALNRLEQEVTVHQLALGDKNSEETIYVAGSGTSLSKEFVEGAFSGTETVQVRKLDDYANEKSLPNPDFIKIDVEGYEQSVLTGGKQLIEKSLPVLYVEIAKTLRVLGRPEFSNASFGETLSLLASMGYEVYVQNGFKIELFDPASSFDGVRMYLFLHKEKHAGIKKALQA
ncbi:MAG TPA: FkbM family methyltransferase [Candidatus Paceibacterota bacterium]